VTLAIAEVAEEYGVNVAHVEPSVVVDVMQQVRSQSFGIRPERFLIDDLLGGAFANAVKQGITAPVTIGGPPYECRVAAH
jgi:hypothetical protein